MKGGKDISEFDCIAVIPARFDSTRFPGKPLFPICGKPMIQWVYERVVRCRNLKEVIIATDHQEVKKAAEKVGAKVVMTSRDIKTGTDRIYRVFEKLRKKTGYILNVQGDEPLIDPESLSLLVDMTIQNNREMGTLFFRSKDKDAFHNPNVVKLVMDKIGRVLYFSRSSIPYQEQDRISFLKHIGVYIFRKDVLKNFVNLSSKLEHRERLEQLRAIENGIPVWAVESKSDTHPVDTLGDIAIVEKILKKTIKNNKK